MRTPKVRLYILIRRTDGRNAFVDPAWNRNRTLRVGYALVAGEAEHHLEGCYYLRFLRNGKRVWQSVGPDTDAAIVALRNRQHDLESVSLGRTAATADVDRQVSQRKPQSKRSLAEATENYFNEVRPFRAPKTIAACERMLGRFLRRFPGR